MARVSIGIQPGIVAGRPHILGHRMPVQHIVVLCEELGMPPEEVASQYNLRLPEVNAALNYYAEHRAEIQQALQEDAEFVRDLRGRLSPRLGSGPVDQYIHYYLDITVPEIIARILRERDVNVVTAREARMFASPDDQHLAYAAAERRVIVAQDVTCLRWHVAGIWHKGIVYAPPQTTVEALVRGLMRLRNTFEPDEMVCHVEFVDSD